MGTDDAARCMCELISEAIGKFLREPITEPVKPSAVSVARMLGYNPDDFSSIEWRDDGIVMTRKPNARTIEFTVGCGVIDKS